MRKFLMVVAVGVLAVAMAAPAWALDFKFGAEYRVRFYTGVNTVSGTNPNPFDSSVANSNPRGAQVRIRPRFDVSDNNGNIQATLRLEIGDVEFGNGGGANGPTNQGWNNIAGDGTFGNRIGPGGGGGLDVDGVNIETKWAYLDAALPFGLPGRVRAGIQPWFLSKGILVDTEGTGVRLYGTMKPFSYDLMWVRANGGVNTNVAAPAGAQAPAYATSRTIDNNYDFYQFKGDVALAPFFNPSVYYLYGRNAATCVGCAPGSAVTGWGNQADSHYFGTSITGKMGIVSYDLDFVYGAAEGGPNGTLTRTTKGWVADAAIHFPLGPLGINLAAAYATGDKRDGGDSEAFPSGPNPSWNGPGGGFEMFGSGGPFDAVEFTQDGPSNIWGLGGWITYVPVKPLTLKVAYGYFGFAEKEGNCGYAPTGNTNACFGPSYARVGGKSSIGQELSIRADYDIWTGFKVQGQLGWIFPSSGDTAHEYVLQLLYNF